MSEFDRLIGELEDRLDQLIETIFDRVDQRYPGWSSETVFTRRQIADGVRISLQGQLRAFRGDALPKSCPEFDAAAARTVARVGEIETFANGYRAAQATLWEAWFGLVEDSALEGEERRELLARGSDFFFRYADLMADFAVSIYREEQIELRSSSTQRRFNAVKGLLEGDSQLSSNPLEINLRQHHLGLIAWGEAGEEACRRLAADLGRPLLLVEPLPGIWWGWAHGARPFEEAERRILERYRSPADAGLAVGLGEFGEQGFRTTHRQAQRARLLAPEGLPSLTRYSEVAVEALATENLEEARNFVARELGPIDDDSIRSRELRETLAAYFAAEYNAASAGARLGVHQQTVANRLRAAEERIGRDIADRRVELELALRLRAALRPEKP